MKVLCDFRWFGVGRVTESRKGFVGEQGCRMSAVTCCSH